MRLIADKPELEAKDQSNCLRRWKCCAISSGSVFEVRLQVLEMCSHQVIVFGLGKMLSYRNHVEVLKLLKVSERMNLLLLLLLLLLLVISRMLMLFGYHRTIESASLVLTLNTTSCLGSKLGITKLSVNILQVSQSLCHLFGLKLLSGLISSLSIECVAVNLELSKLLSASFVTTSFTSHAACGNCTRVFA